MQRTLRERIASERVHRPGSPGYDAATRLWNGAVTYRPAIVVQPTSYVDVQTALRFAREGGIAVSVRGGGHDWAGRSLVDGGLVIDMSLMRRVIVDRANSIATVASGATAAEVIAATEPHGLAAATGMVGQVGMVGVTLGGGYGPLNGIAGLAVDNLVGAELYWRTVAPSLSTRTATSICCGHSGAAAATSASSPRCT